MLLPGWKNACSLTSLIIVEDVGSLSLRFGETSRMSKLTRRMALIGLSTFVASPVGAQTSQTGKPKAESSEIATLEKSAVFEINPNGPRSGTHLRTSAATARSAEAELAESWYCSRCPLGYFTPDEAKLNIIIRAKGGAVLHTWSVGVLVKCTNKDQPLTPLIHEVPNDLAANVFTNVNACEITEHTEPNYPGVKVQRCS